MRPLPTFEWTTKSPAACNVSSLTIPQRVIDGLLAHAREVDPCECCGLLAGKDRIVTTHYRIPNTVATDQQAIEVFRAGKVKPLEGRDAPTHAEVAYFMDPKELLAAFKNMRQREMELVAVYHSHPSSPAYPSLTDIGLAYYPEAAYLIISLHNKHHPDLQGYWIRDGVVSAAPLSIT